MANGWTGQVAKRTGFSGRVQPQSWPCELRAAIVSWVNDALPSLALHESATSVQESAARCSKWRQPEKGRRGREKKDAAHGQFVQSRLPVEVEIG